MEPILPEPIAQEGSQNFQEQQTAANLMPISPETAPSTSQERSFETPSAPGSPTIQPVLAVQPTSPPANPAPQVVSQVSPVADPMMADDVDVIEKEWVDKAKHIVNSTKTDPYQQEQEVSKLQADYLQKRYNKTIKLAE